MHLSPREVRQRFRPSELALLGWRSREQSALLEKRYKAKSIGPPDNTNLGPSTAAIDEETGQPDFSKMTGTEQLNRLRALGFKVPFIPPPPKRKEDK